MSVAFSWTKPNGQILEKARRFCYNPHPFSAMVGGIRNAKTTAACRRVILLALAYPGNRILIARYQNTDLEKSTLAIFKEELARLGPNVVKKHDQNYNFYKLYNGTMIYYAHLDKPEDIQGSEWGGVYIDELHEVKEDTFNQIKSRMTFWNPRRIQEFKTNLAVQRMQKEVLGYNASPKNFFFITQNPSPNWTKRRIKENVDGEFHVIESTTMDNIENLPPDWWDSVKNMPDDWKRRFLEGSWDISGGQVYKEFSTAMHVIEPFEIPEHWERLRGLDFGLRNPTAVSWMAVDEFGNLFLYDEHYKPEMLPEQHATIIKAKSVSKTHENGKVEYFNSYEMDGVTYLTTIADPSGQNRAIGSKDKLFDEYRRHGIACIPGNNDWPLGYARVSQYLHFDPSHTHPRTKQRGSPRLFVFNTCVNTIKEFIGYEWEAVPQGDKDPSDKPKKWNDHLMDEIRYLCATRPDPSKLRVLEEPESRHVQMARAAFTQIFDGEEGEAMFSE
jgi:phage terminase large subunit